MGSGWRSSPLPVGCSVGCPEDWDVPAEEMMQESRSARPVCRYVDTSSLQALVANKTGPGWQVS